MTAVACSPQPGQWLTGARVRQVIETHVGEGVMMFPKLRLRRGIVPEGEPSSAGGPVGTTLGVLIAAIDLSIMLITPSPSTWEVSKRWSGPVMTVAAGRDLRHYPSQLAAGMLNELA